MMHEVQAVLRMLDEVYAVFGLSYTAALSTRPDSFLGEPAVWDQAEAALRDALDAVGKKWEVRPCPRDQDLEHPGLPVWWGCLCARPRSACDARPVGTADRTRRAGAGLARSGSGLALDAGPRPHSLDPGTPRVKPCVRS